MKRPLVVFALFGCLLPAMHGSSLAAKPADDGFVELFPTDGVPEGWRVTHWADVKNPAPEGAAWKVVDGVLHGSTPRGSWLVSPREYGDFTLELEFKIGPQGNSGVGLRFPDAGDPAFDGLELQIVDPRYYGEDKVGKAELTGAIYKGMAPGRESFMPTEWNHYEITCKGPQVTVWLNGDLVQNLNLDMQKRKLERGSPLKDRPRRGHIGFQELSRGGGHVEIRGARIKELSP
jgi:hypothetical protein